MSTTEVVPSISVQRLLLATDFSTASEKAAFYARALAERFSSLVEVAHVFDPSRVATYEDAVLGLPVGERRRSSRDSLEQLRNQFVSSGVETRTISLEGHHPAPELLRVAKEQQIDLIVAGTTSTQGVERLLLGSTAEQLIPKRYLPRSDSGTLHRIDRGITACVSDHHLRHRPYAKSRKSRLFRSFLC
jgi:nucleotide-binding universal stress UspA family protein